MSSLPVASAPPAFLKLLAHDLRWNLLVHLAHSDYRVQELVERVACPMNLVSYHLATAAAQQPGHGTAQQ